MHHIHAHTCTQTHTQTEFILQTIEDCWVGLLKGRHGCEAERSEREANSLRNIVSFGAGIKARCQWLSKRKCLGQVGDRRVGLLDEVTGEGTEEHLCDFPTAPGLGGREMGSLCTGPLCRQKANMKMETRGPRV